MFRSIKLFLWTRRHPEGRCWPLFLTVHVVDSPLEDSSSDDEAELWSQLLIRSSSV